MDLLSLEFFEVELHTHSSIQMNTRKSDPQVALMDGLSASGCLPQLHWPFSATMRRTGTRVKPR